MDANEPTKDDTEGEPKYEPVESPFVALLKNDARLRVLDLILENDGLYVTEEIINKKLDFPEPEIAKQIRILEDIGFVEWEDTGDIHGYRFNDDHEIADELYAFHTQMYRYTGDFDSRSDI